MHFWYALHRHLWWCLIGVITFVQCIFGALFLGLRCNIFLVLRLWCYALSAISRRLATAVAHLLYLHCFQICFQILDCYIHSLRRHAVVSACGFFAVTFRRFLSKKIDNQVNRGLVTSFLATTLTYLALLLQYT